MKANLPGVMNPYPLLGYLKRRRSLGRPTAGDIGFGTNFLGGGGLVQTKTGMGGAKDKGVGMSFVPKRYISRYPLEILYKQSWAAAKFIDIPIDDMMVRWRNWEAGDDEDAAYAMAEAESEAEVRTRIARAMKAGRLYGTGLLCMMTREDNLEMPLNVERIRKGDLANLLVLDRFSTSVIVRDDDLFSRTYGMPLIYELHPRRSGYSGFGNFRIHTSRVLRFDGIRSLGDDGSSIYEQDWGVSELVRALDAIFQEASTAQAIQHLVQEASIAILKVQGLGEVLANQDNPLDPDERSAVQIAEQISEMKSIYRMALMDSTEDFDRVAVQFSGIAELLDRFFIRLAAMADIPATRFLGRSPVGMNATGESDLQNYGHHVAAMQVKFLTDPLRRIDEVLARHAGIQGEPPTYEWPELFNVDPKTQSEAVKNNVESLAAMIDKGVIDEDEAREALDGTPLFGELDGEAPGMPEPDMSLPPSANNGNTSSST